MNSNGTIQFSRRYRTALREFLRAAVGGRQEGDRARALGHEAITLKMDPLTVARVHARSVAALVSRTGREAAPLRTDPVARAGRFLCDVLGPVMRHQGNGKALSRRIQKLATRLRQRSTEMTALGRKLRRQTARRRFSEMRLALGARRNRELLAQARRMQEQSRRLARQLLVSQEEERKEISRDLHDEVAQILAGINVHLAGLRESAAVHDRSLSRRIVQAQHLVEQSVEAVHRFARELRPALLDDLGLMPALRSLIRGLPGRNGLEIQISAVGAIETIDTSRRTVLYRVAQEALTNVVRHAHARSATVRIDRSDTRVRLVVRDDGRSFAADRVFALRSNHRLGLVGMRERVEMLSGTLVIASSPGSGTTVTATVPLRRNGRKP